MSNNAKVNCNGMAWIRKNPGLWRVVMPRLSSVLLEYTCIGFLLADIGNNMNKKVNYGFDDFTLNFSALKRIMPIVKRGVI